MNSSPLISVIIPCYNAERFIAETLRSIFAQTFQDFEVIAIDDGSTDDTSSIIRTYDQKIHAEFSEKRGASAARNRGTELAKGAFIQYVDADDLLCSDSLAKRVAALQESNADVAYTDWRYLSEQKDGSYVPTQTISRQIKDIHSDPQVALFTDFWAPPAALMYRRSIIDRIGGWNESLPVIQDARFLLDSAIVGGSFVYIPSIGADYRVTKDSLSRRNPKRFMEDCLINACQVQEIWEENSALTPGRSQALLKLYGQSARFFFEHDRVLFYTALRKIHYLEPNYAPSQHKTLHYLTRLFGYETAEAVALYYRQLKRFLKKS